MSKFTCISLLLFCIASLNAQSVKTIDFQQFGNALSAFDNAGVQLKEITGISSMRAVPAGHFIIKIPFNNDLHLEAIRGEIHLELKDYSKMSSFSIVSGRLTIEEANV